MSPSERPIRDFMTPSVHTISMESSLPQARAAMSEHGIRHLPVLDGSKLVGIISDRDLARLEGFPMVDFNRVSVPDAMTPCPYVVAPDTPAVEVFRTMRDERYGSAIICEGDEIVGVFTTTDALQVLVDTMS